MDDQVKVTSKKFAINWQDFAKGLFISVGTSVLVAVQRALDATSHGDTISINWQQLGMVAVGALVTYLIKSFFTPAYIQTPVTNKEVEKAQEVLPPTNK